MERMLRQLPSSYLPANALVGLDSYARPTYNFIDLSGDAKPDLVVNTPVDRFRSLVRIPT